MVAITWNAHDSMYHTYFYMNIVMGIVYNIMSQYKTTDNDAVMFDIDDTLINSSNGSINFEILNILNRAKKLGYKIVIITARSPSSAQYTSMQLGMAGIYYDLLIFSPPHLKGQAKRSTGHRYVLSVGDLPTDCTDSIFSFKLPGRADTTSGLTGPRALR